MNTKRPVGLGRNLSALLGQAVPQPIEQAAKTARILSLNDLTPGRYQPRHLFEDESLQALAESIRQQGLLQPLVVRQVEGGRFEILAGERRFRACQLAGLVDVPVMVKHVTDEEAMVIALVENLQREDLNILEQARGMQRLIEEFHLSHQQIASVLSQSRSNVSNILRLLSLSLPVQQYLEKNELNMGHARALLMLDEAAQVTAAKKIVEKKLSVRATETLVKQMKAGQLSESQPAPLSREMLSHEEQLMARFNTKVEIKPGRRIGSGKVVIHYDNETMLAELLESFSTR